MERFMMASNPAWLQLAMKWTRNAWQANLITNLQNPMLPKAKPSRVTRLQWRFLLQKVLILNHKAKTIEETTFQFRLTTNSAEKEMSKLEPSQTKKEAKVSQPSHPRAKKRILQPPTPRNHLKPSLIRFRSRQFQVLNQKRSRPKRFIQLRTNSRVELKRQKQPSWGRLNQRRYRRKTKHWSRKLKLNKRFSRAWLLMVIRKIKLVRKRKRQNPSHHHKKAELPLQSLKSTK